MAANGWKSPIQSAILCEKGESLPPLSHVLACKTCFVRRHPLRNRFAQRLLCGRARRSGRCLRQRAGASCTRPNFAHWTARKRMRSQPHASPSTFTGTNAALRLVHGLPPRFHLPGRTGERSYSRTRCVYTNRLIAFVKTYAQENVLFACCIAVALCGLFLFMALL